MSYFLCGDIIKYMTLGKNRNVFITVLEARKSHIKAYLVTDENCSLLPRW
jgi:hypothetical protein